MGLKQHYKKSMQKPYNYAKIHLTNTQHTVKPRISAHTVHPNRAHTHTHTHTHPPN